MLEVLFSRSCWPFWFVTCRQWQLLSRPDRRASSPDRACSPARHQPSLSKQMVAEFGPKRSPAHTSGASTIGRGTGAGDRTRTGHPCLEGRPVPPQGRRPTVTRAFPGRPWPAVPRALPSRLLSSAASAGDPARKRGGCHRVWWYARRDSKPRPSVPKVAPMRPSPSAGVRTATIRPLTFHERPPLSVLVHPGCCQRCCQELPLQADQ